MFTWLKNLFRNTTKPAYLQVDQLLKIHLNASGFKNVEIDTLKSITFPDRIRAKGRWKDIYFITPFLEVTFLNDFGYRERIVETIIKTLTLKKEGKL